MSTLLINKVIFDMNELLKYVIMALRMEASCLSKKAIMEKKKNFPFTAEIVCFLLVSKNLMRLDTKLPHLFIHFVLKHLLAKSTSFVFSSKHCFLTLHHPSLIPKEVF